MNLINFVSKAMLHTVTVCDISAICYMQNRSNIGYINIRKVAMGAAILDFDRWSHVHALNMGPTCRAFTAAPALRCLKVSVYKCGPDRIVPRFGVNEWVFACLSGFIVFEHSVWLFFRIPYLFWTCPDSCSLGKFSYEIRKIRTGWQLCLKCRKYAKYIKDCESQAFTCSQQKCDKKALHVKLP